MLKRLEWLTALFILIFYAGLLTPSEVAEGGTDVLMSKVSIIVQAIVIPLTMVLVFINWGKMIAGLRVSKLPMAISVLLVLSTAWSIERHVTLRRSLIFFFCTLFSIYLGACLSKTRQIHAYAVMTLISVVGSFAVVALLPSYGISTDTHMGAWKGVFQHKNALGKQMIFSIALLAAGRAFRSPYLRWATILGAFALFGLSRSGTAALGFAALVLGYAVLKTMRVRTRGTLPLWIAMMPVTLVGIFTALAFRAQLSILVGKDPTLTGRTAIWAEAFRGIAQKPYFGWGYASYWRQIYLRAMFNGLPPNHAHSGFIDIAVDIGYFGVLLFVLTLFFYLSHSLKKVLNTSIPLTPFYAFSLVYVVIFLAMNLTESNLLRYHTFLWTPFVSIYTAMGLELVSERSKSAPTAIPESEAKEQAYQLV